MRVVVYTQDRKLLSLLSSLFQRHQVVTIPVHSRMQLLKIEAEGAIIGNDCCKTFLTYILTRNKLPYIIYRNVDAKPTRKFRALYSHALGEMRAPFSQREVQKVVRLFARERRKLNDS